MTETEQREIESIGAQYCEFLDGLIEGLGNPGARAEILRMTLDGILRQYVRRKGYFETAAFLHYVADQLIADARKSLQ